MLVYFWFGVLLVITFLYLFVCVDGHGGGCLARVKKFLFTEMPDLLRNIGRRICGNWVVDGIDAIANYLCY